MAPPAAAYAHGVYVPTGFDLIVTSGVVPTAQDGSVPVKIRDQADLVWKNILVILAEGKMVVRDIISVTTFVVNSADLQDRLQLVMSARDTALGGHLAASTLVTVPALAKPEWLVEISVLAARRPNS